MDGRVIHEALKGGPSPESVISISTILKADRKLKTGVYRQYARTSSVGKTSYVDEGNRGIA